MTVTENVGKVWAYGIAGDNYQSDAYGYGPFGTPVTCDGSPHSYVLDVFPAQGYQQPNSPPFKKGNKAVVTGSFSVLLFDPSCGVYCATDDNYVSFGPQSIRIK